MHLINHTISLTPLEKHSELFSVEYVMVAEKSTDIYIYIKKRFA